MTRRAPISSLATDTRDWVTPRELAAYLAVDVRTVLRMIREQSLYAYRVGRAWRVPTEAARRAFPSTVSSSRAS